MQIGEVIHRRVHQISDKKGFTYQISDYQIGYHESLEMAKKLPFQINEKFHKLIAWQIRRVGLKRFQECAEAAATKNSPERYLMTCLKNEGACSMVPVDEAKRTA